MINLSFDGDLAIITLDNPATLNALSISAAAELADTLEDVSKKARAVVLTGTGRAFCTGADMSAPPDPSWLDADGRMDAGIALEQYFNPLSDCLANLSVPIVTAVNGVAAGYGCTLALLGDLVIASEAAVFSQAFCRIGLIPDGGSTYLLARLVGKARAAEMMLLGDQIDAAKALEWGLVNRVVSGDALLSAATEIGMRLAKGPVSLGSTRRLMWQGLDASWMEQCKSEVEAQRNAGFSQDFNEGKKAFTEKRSPVFQGK